MPQIPQTIIHHSSTSSQLHSILQKPTLSINTIIMKWLLALVPIVAAAPALPTFQGGDAPTPGQVC